MMMTAALMAMYVLAAPEPQNPPSPFDIWLDRFYKIMCSAPALALVSIIDAVCRWMKKSPDPIPGPQGPSGPDCPQGQDEQDGQRGKKEERGEVGVPGTVVFVARPRPRRRPAAVSRPRHHQHHHHHHPVLLLSPLRRITSSRSSSHSSSRSSRRRSKRSPFGAALKD